MEADLLLDLALLFFAVALLEAFFIMPPLFEADLLLLFEAPFDEAPFDEAPLLDAPFLAAPFEELLLAPFELDFAAPFEELLPAAFFAVAMLFEFNG